MVPVREDWQRHEQVEELILEKIFAASMSLQVIFYMGTPQEK